MSAYTTRPAPALKFECGCPQCAGPLTMQSSAVPVTSRTSAMFECADCATSVRITVTMRVCDRRRYDVAPILAHLGVDDLTAARVLHVAPQTLNYYRKNGLSDTTADRLATRLCLHPSAIWPSWWPEEESA